MARTRHYECYAHACHSIRAVLDAASSGFVTTIIRGVERFQVVPADQRRRELARLRPAAAEVLAEGGGWAVIIPGLPVHGDGESFDCALDDAVLALREYAEDWKERLHLAPNHIQHRPVVELVELSTDDQVRDWLVGGAMAASDQDHPQNRQTA